MGVALTICLFVHFLAMGDAEADETKSQSPAPAKANQIDFVRDVKPVLARACFRCHGPEKQKSDYRLDVRQTALKGGESSAPNIIPGKGDASPLVKLISGTGSQVMPPEGPRLSPAEVTLIRRWIDEGAVWPDDVAGEVMDKGDWWSFRPIQKREPSVMEGVASPIDRFIRSKLAERGWQPAPEADRRTLIRRIYFDLVGLPPTPEEVATFVADPNPQAYERLVDSLLASPRYGERWARHWLDAAHFAETHGHDQDRVREHAWPYRDYLVQSLNADKPYGRFIQEQVAGDILFPDDSQATVALGFLAAGPWDESSLRDIREDTLDRQIARYIDRDDMISTVMNNVTSLTVQCARCHDHKFDAITQADHYALQAVFSGVERANRRFDAEPQVHRRRTQLLQRKAALQAPTPELTAELLGADIQTVVANWEAQLGSQKTLWTVIDPESFTSSEGATLTKLPDLSILSGGKRPEMDTVTVVATLPAEDVTGVKLEVLADDSLPMRGPGRQDNGNLHLSEFEVFRVAEGTPVPLINAQADFNQQGWEITKAIDGNEPTAWGIHPQVGQSHRAVFELKEPVVPKQTREQGPQNNDKSDKGRPQLKFVLKQRHGRQHLIGRFRLSVTTVKPPIRLEGVPDPIAVILAVPVEQRTDAQRLQLTTFQQLEQVERELTSLPKQSLVYAAAADFEPDGALRPPPGPRPVHVLHRGDIRHPRELALPGAIAALKDLPSRFEMPGVTVEGPRRAALARWLTEERNPLTWRSLVNRVWHHHFGRGLVSTLNDFGHMGETPSHPELLDWLAADFRDNGQSLKKLHRLLVTSATYKQRSTPESMTGVDSPTTGKAVVPEPNSPATVDADNRLLWRMNRTRLDAESVRDAVLAISGRLDLRMGGPSDRQFDLQPGIHVTPKVDYTKFDVNSEAGRRRSIYRFLFRTLPDPFLESLDCPSGDQIAPARNNSVTVQQALALWNDVFIAKHCEHTATRLTGLSDSLEGRVRLLVQLTLGRLPTAEESTEMTSYANTHGLANLCRLLLNSNEFLFVN